MTGPAARAQVRVQSFWAVRKSESVRRTVSPNPLSVAATPKAKTSSDWPCQPGRPTSVQTLMTDWCLAKRRRCEEGDASGELHGLAYCASEERDGFTTPPPSLRCQDSGRRPLSDTEDMTAWCPAKRRRCEEGDASGEQHGLAYASEERDGFTTPPPSLRCQDSAKRPLSDTVDTTACCPTKTHECEEGDASGEQHGLACYDSEERDDFTSPPPSLRRKDSKARPLSDSIDYSDCLSTGCRPPSWCRAPARSRLAPYEIETTLDTLLNLGSLRAGQRKRVAPPMDLDYIKI